MQLKIETINNTLGLTLPPEIINKLHLKEGNIIDVIETEEGIQLNFYDAEFETVMEAVKIVTLRYKNALKELAN